MRARSSRYIERTWATSPAGQLQQQLLEERAARLVAQAAANEAAWLEQLRGDFSRILEHLQHLWGLKFRGRILEIGAGACAFSAELSKLPQVVEVVATDASRRLLQELAPRVLAHLGAQSEKIVRMPADFHRLPFPEGHFDFVVCSATLHETVDVVGVLREVRRVLKPGGRMVAVREPRPTRVSGRWRWGREQGPADVRRSYSLAEYEAFFAAAGLQLQARPLWPEGGLRAYVSEVWEGLERKSYVFVAVRPPERSRKPVRSVPAAAGPSW
ncbi:MAG: class I SAM-dependent methyltransferase [Limisphaera sp.]|nr:class I SAM-dependent methyltransferase [Limisphaera sp.]